MCPFRAKERQTPRMKALASGICRKGSRAGVLTLAGHCKKILNTSVKYISVLIGDHTRVQHVSLDQPHRHQSSSNWSLPGRGRPRNEAPLPHTPSLLLSQPCSPSATSSRSPGDAGSQQHKLPSKETAAGGMGKWCHGSEYIDRPVEGQHTVLTGSSHRC